MKNFSTKNQVNKNYRDYRELFWFKWKFVQEVGASRSFKALTGIAISRKYFHFVALITIRKCVLNKKYNCMFKNGTGIWLWISPNLTLWGTERKSENFKNCLQWNIFSLSTTSTSNKKKRVEISHLPSIWIQESNYKIYGFFFWKQKILA